MICNQLIEATETLGQLRPRPSNLDIARAVCGNCDRNSNCPSLSLEQAEELERQENNPNTLTPKQISLSETRKIDMNTKYTVVLIALLSLALAGCENRNLEIDSPARPATSSSNTAALPCCDGSEEEENSWVKRCSGKCCECADGDSSCSCSDEEPNSQ